MKFRVVSRVFLYFIAHYSSLNCKTRAQGDRRLHRRYNLAMKKKASGFPALQIRI